MHGSTLQLYEEKLIEKGVQISANNVKIEVDHKTCISKGFLEIIEKIGRETPVEIPEQPAERTTEDGEQHYRAIYAGSCRSGGKCVRTV